MPFEHFFELLGEGDPEALPSMFDLTAKPGGREAQGGGIPHEARRPRAHRAGQELRAPAGMRSRAATPPTRCSTIFHLIYPESRTLLDYRDDPIVVMDQPAAARALHEPAARVPGCSSRRR